MVPHRTVLRFVSWANAYFGVRDDDRNSGHSPLHFDLSSYDIYGTLAAGAELHLVPPALNLLPAKLAAFIRERRLTQWFSVPSILSYMARFDAVRPGDFPDLRRVLWCGEVFPTPPLRYWMSRLPSTPFTNLYGPTETTIASSYHTLPSIPASDRDEVPIGAPCEGETLAVVDDAMRPVPDGTIGELVIGGEGLTLGYWEDAETTARAFVEIGEGASRERVYRTGDLARRDPLGAFYFLGRKDSQIKSRGYRIELGEIETALFAIDALADAAVVAVPTQGFEGHVICCAYVPREAGLTPVALRTRLAAAIPSYMIPTKWHSFAELPKTSNGKTDRKALRELFAQGDGGDDAR
ncbi:MAG: D-alanine--poly(phosphoribitol) ligase [Acidobacteria bacterium]|nr:D-alanine--poly(phosphoribitol) ligase [Acidobacteriota bacterium]